jgi:hypothetical protein
MCITGPFLLGIIHLFSQKMNVAQGRQEKKEADKTFVLFANKDPLLI